MHQLASRGMLVLSLCGDSSLHTHRSRAAATPSNRPTLPCSATRLRPGSRWHRAPRRRCLTWQHKYRPYDGSWPWPVLTPEVGRLAAMATVLQCPALGGTTLRAQPCTSHTATATATRWLCTAVPRAQALEPECQAVHIAHPCVAALCRPTRTEKLPAASQPRFSATARQGPANGWQRCEQQRHDLQQAQTRSLRSYR